MKEESSEGGGVPPAKKESSNISNDDFVLINDRDVPASSGARPRQGQQGDGYAWVKQLVFRAKLTMHTAFERADNARSVVVRFWRGTVNLFLRQKKELLIIAFGWKARKWSILVLLLG